MRRSKAIGVVSLVFMIWSGILLMFSPPAWAVPSFARRYGVTCSTCHSSWPELNSTGLNFKLSGYRRLNGMDMQPTTPDIDLGSGALKIPSIPPLALVAATGFDLENIRRRAADGTRASQMGSSLDLNSVALFLASPLGDHLSAFFEFPLFETHAPDNDFPTGPSGANATDITSKRNITRESEVTGFEIGKAMWNSLLPMSILPPDSLNIKVGVDQLPVGFSPESNRLSIVPYLVYRRRALDLLSPIQTDDLLANGDQADRLNRIAEPQIQVALNGLFVPFGVPMDVGKFESLIVDYEFGVTNGSNNTADPNTQKDFFGHVGVRWWGQRLGFFAYRSPDLYDDSQREDASLLNGGIFSGEQRGNSFSSFGPDLTLSLEPFDIPVWLQNEVLFNRESHPTAFRKSFSWWGGFTQLNGKIPVNAKFLQWITAYARYEWLRGDRFDDTTVGGVTGPVKPREWQAVAGLQWFVLENLKVVTEYSRREFRNDESTPVHQRLRDSFFTVRAVFAF